MITLANILLLLASVASADPQVLPVEDMDEPGAQQALQQNLDSRFSVTGGTITGHVHFSSSVTGLVGTGAVGDVTLDGTQTFTGTNTFNQPIFHPAYAAAVQHGSGLVINQSTWTTIVYDVERYDQYAMHTAGVDSGTMTIVRSGLYQVFFQGAFTSTSNNGEFGCRIGATGSFVGFIAKEQYFRPSGSPVLQETVTCAVQINMTAGDTLYAQVFQSSDVTLNLNSDGRYSQMFSIAYLGDLP